MALLSYSFNNSKLNLHSAFMAYYGNILTVLSSTDDILEQIKVVLQNNDVKNQLLGQTFFIETSSKENTRAILNGLDAKGIHYLWFHNHISDGSRVYTGQVNATEFENVRRILLESHT